MGRKKGMVQIFDEEGNVVVCTVIKAESNVVAQIKTKERDGYNALQLGFEKIKGNKASKPLRGHYNKNKIECRRVLLESRMDDVDKYFVGQEIDVGIFSNNVYLDVQGVSKGKGFQGVMKLHGFAGGPASHGSGFRRHGGSIGMRSTPGFCFKGSKRPSRMGGNKCMEQNLKIVNIDVNKNVILVKGAVPGSIGSLVCLSPSIKSGKKIIKSRI